MAQDAESALHEEIRKQDDMYYQLGDSLDVKTSIILVIVTFLGTLSEQILVINNLPMPLRIMQILCVVILSCVIGMCLTSLWPTEFDTPPKPEEWSQYIAQLQVSTKEKTMRQNLYLTNSSARELSERLKESRRIAH